ncbi:MAG TPA: group I intron-associated PD-(D/E)XK endonuclease [Solirubrobacterales bacterium]|nr:group I intron-associated PD-(D/E)XK endonuclease [Solirubrobacterales bacterium]
MKTATRGNAAEARILAEFVCRGFNVLTPFGGGQPYDLAVDLGEPTFLRVQCKTAWLVARGCLAFNSRSTDHGRGRVPYHGLADLFAVHLPPTDAIYLIPVDAVPGHLGRLRLRPAKNNQRRGVRFAADFEIERWSEEKLRALSA